MSAGVKVNGWTERRSRMIKYRVFDGEKMWYPEDCEDWYIDLQGDLYLMDEFDDYGRVYERLSLVADAIAMLSIDMTDRNDREVWVGDIVSFMPRVCGEGERIQGEVQLGEGRFFLMTPEERGYSIDNIKHGEVVGNIYEQ